jgi:ornithine cyclodeaminase/alanine dehydrogenase-like protein (mu-crystallin family)
LTETPPIQANDAPNHRRLSVLTYDAVVHLLDWRGAIEALRQGHQLARPQLGDLLIGPAEAMLLNRAAYIAGLGYAVKAETVIPGNAAKGLPSVQGAVLLFDAETGSVRGIIESKLVTEYKTAADSVLAAQLLARPDSRHLLIVGAGTVAASLARAYSAIFPTLERISIWARRPEQAKALIASLKEVGTELTVTADLKTAARTADIVSTATMSREPILFGDWIRPGTHVDLIGAFTPDMREADDTLMAKGKVFVDCRQTTIDCIGELMQPIAAGAITRSDIRGDLYDLIASTISMRQTSSEITVFKNGGGAHLDLMIATYIANAIA